MFPPLGSAAPPAAIRLIAALAASISLHAAVAFALAAAPPGSLTGEGNQASPPLQARIVGPDPNPSAPVRHASPARPEARAAAPLERPTADRVAAAPPPPPEERSQPFGLREDATHYLPSELDVRPLLRSSVDPPYPEVAPPEGGYLVLRLLISETGHVERVFVVVADPEGFFETTATEAFAGARFSPGRRGGVAVKSQTWIELKFHPLAPAGADESPR
jgi:outer membrane biosynthesis protein TonB